MRTLFSYPCFGQSRTTPDRKDRVRAMKFLHTADLHIGKRLHECSLIEDQRYILHQIYELAIENKVDAVILAGDIYDRAVPTTEAVELLDEFLTALTEAEISVIMISGNHDSAVRVGFADRILAKQGIHIGADNTGVLKSVVLEDAFGPVTFVCMPFVKPAVLGCTSLEEAVEKMLSAYPMVLSLNSRYVLVTHYFVTGEQGECPCLCDSEVDVNVGGLDNVPVSLFSRFSYVALGHLHRPQQIGSRQVYYSGSPLKYSFSEARGEKSVNLVELTDKEVKVSLLPLKPLRELRCIKGTLSELISNQVQLLNEKNREDFFQVTLTDRSELIDPMSTLRSVYPNVLLLLFEKNKSTSEEGYESRVCTARKSTTELFGEFYEMLKGEPLDEKRKAAVEKAAKEAEEEL